MGACCVLSIAKWKLLSTLFVGAAVVGFVCCVAAQTFMGDGAAFLHVYVLRTTWTCYCCVSNKATRSYVRTFNDDKMMTIFLFWRCWCCCREMSSRIALRRQAHNRWCHAVCSSTYLIAIKFPIPAASALSKTATALSKSATALSKSMGVDNMKDLSSLCRLMMFATF